MLFRKLENHSQDRQNYNKTVPQRSLQNIMTTRRKFIDNFVSLLMLNYLLSMKNRVSYDICNIPLVFGVMKVNLILNIKFFVYGGGSVMVWDAFVLKWIVFNTGAVTTSSCGHITETGRFVA